MLIIRINEHFSESLDIQSSNNNIDDVSCSYNEFQEIYGT